MVNINKRIRKIVVSLSLFIIVGSVTTVYVSGQTDLEPNRDRQEASRLERGRVNRVKYEQLRPGMSLTEVRSILLYEGIEIERSATTAIFVWSNPDGSKITATFERDRLKSKQQSGLQ